MKWWVWVISAFVIISFLIYFIFYYPIRIGHLPLGYEECKARFVSWCYNDCVKNNWIGGSLAIDLSRSGQCGRYTEFKLPQYTSCIQAQSDCAKFYIFTYDECRNRFIQWCNYCELNNWTGGSLPEGLVTCARGYSELNVSLPLNTDCGFSTHNTCRQFGF